MIDVIRGRCDVRRASTDKAPFPSRSEELGPLLQTHLVDQRLRPEEAGPRRMPIEPEGEAGC